MSKYKKPEFSIEELGTNNLNQDLEIPVKTIHNPGYYKEENGIKVPHFYEYETTGYTKWYNTAEIRKTIALCSPNAVKLLMWISLDIPVSQEFIWLNKERYMEESMVSKNTLKQAIIELERYEFIKISRVRDVYWINPHYFFKGSRVSKYPEKIKEKIKEKINKGLRKKKPVYGYGVNYSEDI